MTEVITKETGQVEENELGVMGTEATYAWLHQTCQMNDQEIADFLEREYDSGSKGTDVRFFGTKAKVKTFWDSCQYKITRWRLQGKAVVVYGYDQGMRWTNPDSGEESNLKCWKAFFPATCVAISFERMEHRANYRTYVDESPSLIVHFPMWMKEIRVYPCRRTVVEGQEKDKNEA